MRGNSGTGDYSSGGKEQKGEALFNYFCTDRNCGADSGVNYWKFYRIWPANKFVDAYLLCGTVIAGSYINDNIKTSMDFLESNINKKAADKIGRFLWFKLNC